ncbi:cation-translocating P-type ATPase [Gemmatimonas sp.]|jgi:Ca2+-transporting ATPase|uniref:cation-translocating P-type ATPase n=1 Tax=Gemmatimonas sp. TaxID=1962908 RepID=UPI0037C107C4
MSSRETTMTARSSGTPPSDPWHTVSASATVDLLHTDVQGGLSSADIARLRAEYGDNVLEAAVRRGPLRMLVAQFTDVMVLVLLAAAGIAALVGEPEDIIAIIAIVILNATLGFVQEYRAEKAMAALGAMAAASARVRRDGTEQTIPPHELVPGDIVLLDAGTVVPADLRLLEVSQLSVEEAALTGESLPVQKVIAPHTDPAAPLGDRTAMVYKGTNIASGRGLGVVVGTGMQTELGRIAALLQNDTQLQTPLQQRLTSLGRWLALTVLIVCVAIFATGMIRGEPVVLMFMTAVSLAVAAIPEALPAVITVSLALGARRMVQHHALIRRLPAVETLGSVTYVCTDKTGTLTENRMHVDTIRTVDDEPGASLATTVPLHEVPLTFSEALTLCTDVNAAADGALVGDPTETALVRWAAEQGVDASGLHAQWPRNGEIPFSSERARMTTVHATADGAYRVACTKGAPERVIPACARMWQKGTLVPIDAASVLAHADTMAASGLRVLAIAMNCDHQPATAAIEPLEEQQVLLALVGLLDPPRDEARDAVRTCHAAGIRVVMITGDHPATARAIASRLGIIGEDQGDQEVLTGAALQALDDDTLLTRVEHARVYARVTPEDKLRIVTALQSRGEYAAMTGDGVNDAPALKRANIGIAMGRGGTDVAREAADMVLLDDNFATIVVAVREGRRIYDNIRRFVRFVLSTNAGEIWTLFLAPLIGLPLPLLPIHILWMNLVTDGLPGLTLSAEPAEADIMQRPPRPPRESILAHGLWQHAVWVGLLMAALALGTQAWTIRTGNGHWQTMTFTVLTLSQLTHVLAIRSERTSLFRLGVMSNPLLLLAVVVSLGLQLAIIYVPALNALFKTAPITPGELVLCLVISSVVFFAVELEKYLVRRRGLYADPARTP